MFVHALLHCILCYKVQRVSIGYIFAAFSLVYMPYFLRRHKNYKYLVSDGPKIMGFVYVALQAHVIGNNETVVNFY